MSNIQKTEAFLKERFAECAFFQEHPEDGEYRLQHSYRVANAAGEIARREGLDVEGLVIGGLLHDVGYCILERAEDWLEHGRMSARLARPFMEELGLEPERVQEICYGIAIHVDGKADFPGERTAFALSIGDADDVDRFDAYRIYDAMVYADFRNLKLEDKKNWLGKKLNWIAWRLEQKAGTETAGKMIAERLQYQRQYYERVLRQLECSERV
ncbi:MAG: HD domain-containing protein [Ruminococcus flavefaciens]|nr:HD domain-containing protein [Ruminococcus flavefaciens]